MREALSFGLVLVLFAGCAQQEGEILFSSSRDGIQDVYVMDADGSHVRQLTRNGAANFGPYFHPDGRRIIYSSNAGTGHEREFELFLVDKETGETEQVTFSAGFDGFPQFSPDGEWFVWASNRADPGGRSTNLFIARWVD